MLTARRDELTALEAQLAELRAAAEAKQAEQEAALNAALQAQGDVEAQIAGTRRRAAAAERLAAQLQQQAAAQEAAIEEARRRAAAEEAARRAAARDAAARAEADATERHLDLRVPLARAQLRDHPGVGTDRLRRSSRRTRTAAPTTRTSMPASTSPVAAARRSTRPAPAWSWPRASRSGRGTRASASSSTTAAAIQTWYWHMQPNVVVGPGTIVTSDSVIGYEGSTGMSTGCHVHFAVNDDGVWENPRAYLP